MTTEKRLERAKAQTSGEMSCSHGATGYHDWQPLKHGEGRRFQCTLCNALGYNNSLRWGKGRVKARIKARCCRMKGCDNAATHMRWRGITAHEPWCEEHRRADSK